MHPRPEPEDSEQAGAPRAVPARRSPTAIGPGAPREKRGPTVGPVLVREVLKQTIREALERKQDTRTPAMRMTSMQGVIVVRSPRIWARPLAAALATAGEPPDVLIASVDDSNDVLTAHLLAAESRVPIAKLSAGFLNSQEWITLCKAASALHERELRVRGRLSTLAELPPREGRPAPGLCVLLGLPPFRDVELADAHLAELASTTFVIMTSCEHRTSRRARRLWLRAANRIDVTTIVEGPRDFTEGLALRGEIGGMPFATTVSCLPEWHLVMLDHEVTADDLSEED